MRQNSENAQEARHLADNNTVQVTNTGELMVQLVDSMQWITQSSRQMADIIDVIDSIAFQFNMFALNASSEVARSVAQIMYEISAASEQQNHGIAQVNQAVAEMDQGTQRNAVRVQETSLAAVSLEKQAGLLALSVEAFRLNSQAALSMPTVKASKQAAHTPSVLAAPPHRATPPNNSPVKRQTASTGEWESF